MNDEMMISGKWFNKNTGEVVNVVNNIIDGDDMIVVTDKGTINLNDFGEYIQMSDEIYDENGKIIGNEQVDYKNMVIPKTQTTIKETKSHFDTSVKTLNKESYDYDIEQNNKPKTNVSNHIISKFFDKIQDKDKLLNITFNDEYIPINDLKTIIDYMDVTPNEIANYIVTNIIRNEYIQKLVKNKLIEILKAD